MCVGSRPKPQPQRQQVPQSSPSQSHPFYSSGGGIFGKSQLPDKVYNSLNIHARRSLDSGGSVPLNPSYYNAIHNRPPPSRPEPPSTSSMSRSQTTSSPVVNTVYQTVEVPSKKEPVKYGDSGLTIGDPEGTKRSRKAGTKKGKKRGLSQFDTALGSGNEPVPLGLGVSSGINIPV